VKLHADNIVATDRRYQRSAVIGCRQNIPGIGGDKMIAMQIIGLSRFQQIMPRRRAYVIPAHMRDLYPVIGRLDRLHGSADPAETVVRAIFDTLVGQHLHADTYAEKWHAILPDPLFQSVDHPVDGKQSIAARAKGANARQYDPVGLRNDGRIRCHGDIPGPCRDQRIVNAVQVAGTEIDKGDGFSHGAIQPPKALKLESPGLFSREAAKARRASASGTFFAASRLRVINSSEKAR